MESIGNRVRKEREAQGLSRTELCRRVPIGYSTLAELENGGMQTSTKLHKIAAALGVTLSWLETGKGDKYPPKATIADDEYGDVLGYAAYVGLSDGVEAEEYAETHSLKFRKASLEKKRLAQRNLAVIYGKGDSMEPRIHSGDAILFDQSDTKPRDGHIYVIMVPGAGAESYSVKRCEIIDEMVFFKADNPKGDHGWKKPKRMDDARHPIKIIGRVRWIGSWEG